MFKFSNSTPWKRGWLGIAASNLSSLVFALVFSFMSMSVLLPSDEALAVDDCGAIQKHSTSRAPSNQRINCGIPANYQPGSERDDRGFPLTADENGVAPSAASDGNIVYSMSEFIVVQKYTPDGATEAVNRPWWQARCFPNNDADTQMCWTTVTGTVTPPSDPKKIYYRMVDDDGTPDRDSGTGDYAAGPATGTYGSVKVATVIGIPDSDIDQVATQKVDPSDNSKLVAADHNQYFLNATSPMYGNHVQINLGFEHGATIRGIKERVYMSSLGIATRVPRSYPTMVGGQPRTYDGPDEDGFGRYAVKWDVSTSIGVRLRQLLLFTGGRGDDGTDNTIIEGGADKVSKIENSQINAEGGSRDGGGIDFGGDGNEMVLRLGVPKGDRLIRTTVIARSAGEDSSFHAVHLHQDTQRGGVGEIRMVDATINMLNGGSSPEEGRGKIVTTGDDSSGITISVANPVGDDDEDGDPTGGIEVQVNTPVTIKTSGARSHGIVLNLGYDTDQAKLIEALEQRAAVLLEASHRDTALRIGMNQGTVHKTSNNLLVSAGYTASVRIATNGDKSGGIVIRNSGAAEEGGAAVQLVGTTTYAFVSASSDLPNDLADYSLVVDKPVVTIGAGSHGVVASIGESGITMVVDIKGFTDVSSTTDVDESEALTISTGRNPNTWYRAFDGSGSTGRFTVNVEGHVKGDIVTGDGVVSSTDNTGDTINVGKAGADDDDPDLAPTITGGIDAGDGDDTVNVMFGTVTGTVSTGSGCDTVDLKAGVSVGSVSFGRCPDRASDTDADAKNKLITEVNIEDDDEEDDDDKGYVEAGGNTQLNLAVEDGDDRKVSSVRLTGHGTTTVDGGTIGGIKFTAETGTTARVVVGTSANPVTLDGEIEGGTGNIEGGAGNDEVVLSSGTRFSVDDASTTDRVGETTTINLGAGNDKLEYTAVRGTATQNARRNLPVVNAGAGCDTIELKAASTGTGTDSTVGGINLGAGAACGGTGMKDQLTSNVVITGDITSSGDSNSNSMISLTGGSVRNLMLGGGNDVVQLSNGASVSGTVNLGDGDNNWQGGGSISGPFTSGSGNDTVVLDSGYMVETVDLGAGNNMLTSSQISALTSIASDSAGASGDTPAESTTVQLNSGGVSNGMTFGAGNDVARWVGAVTVSGAVVLGGGDDTVDGGRMNGSIAGGDGDDTVTLRSGTVTSMTGVETFNKMGPDKLTVRSMSNPPASSSTLSGSTAAAGEAITVNVNQGKLEVSGHLDLGTAGTLTVNQYASLSFNVRGMSSQYNDDGEPVGTPSHGRITAGRVIMLAAQPEIELLSGSDADNAAATVARLFLDNTKVVRQADAEDEITPTIVSGGDTPRVLLPGTPSQGTRPPAAADDDDNTAIYAVGALAVLWWVMRRDDMGSGSGLVDYESGTAERSFATISGSRTHSSGAMKIWANYYSDSASPVQGLAVGMETPISSNGSFSFSAMPEAKGSLSLNTLSLNQKSSFQGGHYSVKGKWQSEDYFATAELSYADAVSSTSFDNPTAGGKLSGKFDMTNSHLEISAGAKVQLTDKVSVVPTVGVYGGSVSQSESVLTGRSVVAQMSKQEQSYAGWNLGIRVQPDAWTTYGAEFQPNFSLNTFRTSSDSRSLDLRQSDKAGVLDFSSQLPVQGMPAVVNAFRAGMTMKSETGLKLDLDYVGMEIDGELQHGAIARMQTRF